MPAYFILIRDKTTDAAELELYHAMAPASASGHEITQRVIYGELSVLEGSPAEAVAILEFPTIDDARAWYESPGYQRALAHRQAGSNSRAFIVQGV